MVKMCEDETAIPDLSEREGYALADSLAVRIDWLNNALERQTRALLEVPFGLTPVEWRCLATLCVRGSFTGTELAERTNESPSQISRALRRLRDNGLIAWPAGSRKRGFGAPFVLEKGQALFERVKPVMLSRNFWLLDGLDPSEQEAVYRLVAKLRARMEDTSEFEKQARTLHEPPHKTND